MRIVRVYSNVKRLSSQEKDSILHLMKNICLRLKPLAFWGVDVSTKPLTLTRWTAVCFPFPTDSQCRFLLTMARIVPNLNQAVVIVTTMTSVH